jgi:hypothetical protein
VYDVLGSSGQPLDAATRAFFEPRFGHDFSRVRVHADSKAAESARAVNALAYTVGSNVVFGAGQYQPGAAGGRHLLGHELTHVVQQQGQAPSRGQLRVGPRDDAYEREADHASRNVMSGEKSAAASVRGAAPASVQRACGAAEIGKPAGCTLLEGDVPGKHYLFNVNCDVFKPGEEVKLEEQARGFTNGGIAKIHGFASEEGDPEFNLHLACARTIKANEVVTRVLAEKNVHVSIQLYNHGPQPGNREDRRSITVEWQAAPEPQKEPEPKPEPKEEPKEESKNKCGPDITDSLGKVFATVDSYFHHTLASTWQRRRSCMALTEDAPIVGVNPLMAWDVTDLFLPNTGWLDFYYRRKGCGSPRDPGCEKDGTRHKCEKSGCGNSVVVGDKCMLAGTANYGLYGKMWKLCHDEFPYAYPRWGMTALVSAYNIFDTPAALAMAQAVFDGTYPSVPAKAASRAHCDGRCGLTHGGVFDFVWEPYKERI